MTDYRMLAIICAAAHALRTLYEIAKHHKRVKTGGIVFAAVFTDMAALWITWFSMGEADPMKISIPDLIRYAGLALSALGLVIFLWALLTIKTLESYNGKLITSGIYSWFRHPMYAAFIMWLAGYPLYCGAVFTMYLAVPFILNVLYWRHLEEKELMARFEEYAEYKKRVKYF